MEENNDWVELCLLLKKIAKGKEISHQQIADSTGFKRSNVTRMLNGNYAPGLDNFLKLCKAIGVEIIIK